MSEDDKYKVAITYIIGTLAAFIAIVALQQWYSLQLGIMFACIATIFYQEGFKIQGAAELLAWEKTHQQSNTTVTPAGKQITTKANTLSGGFKEGG